MNGPDSLTALLPAPLTVRASQLLAGFAAVLAVFHSWLLWRRLADGVLLEPRVGLRWVAGVVLVGALAWLRSQGVPLLWGRRALGFWTLVLLLHAGTAAEAARVEAGGRGATVAVVVLPATATLVTILLAFVLPAAGAGPALRLRASGLVTLPPARSLPAAVLPALAARPPPVVL